MSQLKKVFYLVVALMVATLAGPSFGGNPPKSKQYHLATSSSAATTIDVYLTNVSTDTGNSTFTAFTLTFTGLQVPTNGSTVLLDVDNVGKPTKNGGPQKSAVNSTLPDGTPITTITVSNVYPVKVASGSPLAPVYHLQITGNCGHIALASATVYTILGGQTFAPDTATAGGFPFPDDVSCGDIDCGISKVIPSTFYSASVTRGTYDKNGDIVGDFCVEVPYTVTDLGNGKKHFEWPTTGVGSDGAAAFLYTFTGALTQVAWLESSPGVPAFVTGQACLPPPTAPLGSAGVLPGPYGKLSVADTGISTITVDTTGALVVRPASGNFDIIIGTDRIKVNYASTPDSINYPNVEVWNVVQRDVGGTSGSLGAQNDPVMYTPLPLLDGPAAPYGDGISGHMVQAQMCIVLPAQSPGNTQFIDIGDGYHAP